MFLFYFTGFHCTAHPHLGLLLVAITLPFLYCLLCGSLISTFIAELLASLWVQQKETHTSHKPCYHDTCRINYFCYKPAVDLHVNANPQGSVCQFSNISILNQNCGVKPLSLECMV